MFASPETDIQMNSSVQLIKSRRFGDGRGWFAETYSARSLAERGIDLAFVQDNHSYSAHAGTIRGIHFQRPPYAQAKLVRCIRGSIIDYAIDLRRGSPTYGRHLAVELSADNGDQLFVPVGFGHAFITLEPGTEVVYKVSELYTPEADGGVAWNDPDVAIDWPLPPGGPVLSPKDSGLPSLREFDSPFDYSGAPLELRL